MTSISEFRAQIIRQVEQAINTKKTKMDLLIEEAEKLESEIAELRLELRFQKTGQASASAAVVQPTSEEAVSGGHEKFETPVTERKVAVRMTDAEFVRILQEKAPATFTSAQAVKATGLHLTTVLGKLHRLQENGKARQVTPQGRFVPGKGRTAATWRVTAIRAVAS